MNIKLFYLLSIFYALCSFYSGFAYIIDSDQLKTIYQYIPPISDTKNILIVFDLDNTLIETTQELGSDQWFYHQVQEYTQHGLSFDQAVPYVLPLYYLIRDIVDVRLVESDAPRIIRTLQQKNFSVIALTAQGFHLVNRTTTQLKNLGIDFSASSFFGNYIERQYHCHNGIIFCHGNNKKTVLSDVFKHNHYHPHVIICIDDKTSNLEYVKELAHEHCINFYGIRYSRLDDKVAHFDALKAHQELKRFYNQHSIAPIAIPQHIYKPSEKNTAI